MFFAFQAATEVRGNRGLFFVIVLFIFAWGLHIFCVFVWRSAFVCVFACQDISHVFGGRVGLVCLIVESLFECGRSVI